MASTRLAEAVGYPGSSVAFAQLLSGMERDGLIVREIRGKRTYRITLPDGVAAESAARAGSGIPADGGLAGAGLADSGSASPATGGLPAGARRGGYAVPTGFDYDELARRLLVQVVRRLASSSLPTAVGDLATVDVAGALAESTRSENASAESLPAEATPAGRDSGSGAGSGAGASGDNASGDGSSADSASRDSERAALQQTVVGLERELATAWSKHGTLTAENARLREQLNQAQRDLARERTRRAKITSELNQAEVVLLERLLTPAPEDEEKHSDAAAKLTRPPGRRGCGLRRGPTLGREPILVWIVVASNRLQTRISDKNPYEVKNPPHAKLGLNASRVVRGSVGQTCHEVG